MTKSNQKPLYKTRFMLDELGNLQSEGHGISNFQTMLSIGLGQDQQFTIILQTLQQLRDVYGESVDKIVQGNTSNIIFLKSTDDSMLETLQKMSGTKHEVFMNQKTVTRDLQAILMPNEGKVSYGESVQELPTISYNDMAFLPMRNAIVFRAGDMPIWDRNETVLLMSWRLFQNTIIQPGKDYSLQTIPTLSSALEFDVRKNQPDFVKMWEKRRDQAQMSQMAKDAYMAAYGYAEYDVAQLDPDVWADEIMDVINEAIQEEQRAKNPSVEDDEDVDEDDAYDYDPLDDPFVDDDYEDNDEVKTAVAASAKQRTERDEKRYAGGMLSRDDLMRGGVAVNHAYDDIILTAFRACMGWMFKDKAHFLERNGSLVSAIDGAVFIQKEQDSVTMTQLKADAENPDSRVFADSEKDIEEFAEIGNYTVSQAFYRFLISLDSWSELADGQFEREMARLLKDGE